MNSLTPLVTVSSTCIVFQLLTVTFPFVCILSLTNHISSRGFGWCCVAGLALYELLLFLLGTGLGHLGLLAPPFYRTFFVIAFCVLLVRGACNLPFIFGALKDIRYHPSLVDPIIVASLWQTAKLVDSCLTSDWSSGTTSYDSLHYHIPRALTWSLQGSLAPTATNIWQQLAHPYGGAATLLPITFLGCGWLGASYTSVVLSLGAAAALFTIARSLGLCARPAIIGAMFFLSCPLVGWRMVDTSTDIAATFPIIAAVALVLSAQSIRESVFLFPLLVGLGTSIKQYALFPAVPIGLFLFIPRLRSIFATRTVIAAGAGGILLAALFGFLSFYPIYRSFGNLSGNGLAFSLSNVGAPWREVKNSMVFPLLEWIFEPLRFFPEAARAGIAEGFKLSKVFSNLGFPGYNGFLNQPDREHCRAGLLTLAFLPWLVSALPSWKKRLGILIGFIVICCAQFAPIAINHVGARFSIIPVAAFCLLFSLRAARSLITVSLLLLCVVYTAVQYLPRGQLLEGSIPRFDFRHQYNEGIYRIVKSDKVLLLGRDMSNDARIAGTLGQVKFEYFKCPNDGNWDGYFIEAKKTAKWILFWGADESFIPGPAFQTTLGPACPRVRSADFKSSLERSGWKFHALNEKYELWGTS